MSQILGLHGYFLHDNVKLNRFLVWPHCVVSLHQPGFHDAKVGLCVIDEFERSFVKFVQATI